MALLRSLLRTPLNQYSCLIVPKLHGSVCRQVHMSAACHILQLYNKGFLQQADEDIEVTIADDDPAGPARVDAKKFRPGAGVFPTKTVFDMKVGGVPFTKLPTVHIASRGNNTIVTITENGKILGSNSGGMMGLATAKKGTSVGAEMIASTVARQMVKKGIVNVRVILKGISTNHVSAMEALVESGMNVISITDNTFYKQGYRRPLKPQR